MLLKWETFEAQWPRIAKCLWWLATDNNLVTNAVVSISTELWQELDIAENLAAKLSDGQLEVLCTDEESIVSAMVASYDLQPLDSFLNQAFYGVFRSVFFLPPFNEGEHLSASEQQDMRRIDRQKGGN